VLGPGEHVGNRAALDHLACIHDVHAVHATCDKPEVVRDEQDGHTVCVGKFIDEIEDLSLSGDVEGRCGFVCDQQLGTGSQCHGQHDALLLSAAELAGVGLRGAHGVGQSGLCEQANGGCESFGVSQAAQTFADLFVDAHHGIEACGGVLENVGDAAAPHGAPFATGQRQHIGPFE